MVLVIGGLAVWEFRGLSDRMGYRAPSWLLYPLGLVFAFSGTLLNAVPLELVLSITLIAGLSVFLVLPGRREGLGRWAMGLAGAVYIGLPFNYYLRLYDEAHRAPGVAWVGMVVLTVVVSDASALLAGMWLGRHPFFPAISPKKTVEGALAGLLCSVSVMVVGGMLLLGLPIWHAAVLGLLIGVTAQAGDLVESQMKRLARVKDSSNLIPGHGGALDRLDSALFPPIVVFLYASYLHLL
ncbi:MAG: phosphatidate cytidylyltransferase [Chloroflexi bacterium]|nr:MAG: phosphatidate cytidylyltransferase [Chloroflexota bacterium]